eukprot:GDKI01033805.1.p3 GENE.GDKI01033805.1~~GDKI01033805.1.p3  ORF type:complete len:115 (+),score=12.35 GDKI01033805.1:23-346(+)
MSDESKPLGRSFGVTEFTEVERLTATNVHAEDPRWLQHQTTNACYHRFTMFTRCAREFSEDDTRCKFQYYRAQVACPQEYIDMWMEHRERGKCYFDELPEKTGRLMP